MSEIKKFIEDNSVGEGFLHRWYVCDCGYENDRDYNAAMNIRDCGTRLLAW